MKRRVGASTTLFSPPRMMSSLLSALLSTVRLFPSKCPKAPIRSDPKPSQAKHRRASVPQTHSPASITTTNTPPSPRRLRPLSCGDGAVSSLQCLTEPRRQLSASGYGGEAQGGWSLDCTANNGPGLVSATFLELTVRRGFFSLFFLIICFYRCTVRMQGKEASLCTGCWRLTLLSCVLALHLIPLSVRGNAVGTNATEPDNAVNATSLLSEEEGPVKVNEAAVVTVTGTSSSASPDTVTPRAGRIPRAGEEDEQSSGMFGEKMVPVLEEVGVAAPPQLSPDSAETEHLLPSNPRGQDILESEEEEEMERLPHTDPPWIHAKDTDVFDLDRLFTTTTTQPPAPTNPSNPDVLHVDFFDPSSRGRDLDLAPPSPSSLAHELQGGDPTSWALPDSYDYLTPYEDGVSPTADEYTYSTTTDAYESDEDLRFSAGSPARSKPRAPGSGSFVPGAGAPVPNVPVAAPPAASPVDGSDGMGGCRVGYQMANGSCRSPCDMLPNYCFNGGQCYLLEGMGVFCRCNVQDYIWHKGARCESVVTEFQVMCLAVGASALVVLLLFMIIVCFAKKLHVLKTENKKLRKRSSKYRPSSEQHNDNFSLSTIAEGSHPNDDPNSQNKLEDPVKAPPKEDDSLNIHNSLTPKHENHKVLGEENSSEVNSLQNNMM